MDFKDEDDYYENNAVAIEMGTMGREYECSRQSQIAAGGENTHPDISNLAWGQVQQAKARYIFYLELFFFFLHSFKNSVL